MTAAALDSRTSGLYEPLVRDRWQWVDTVPLDLVHVAATGKTQSDCKPLWHLVTALIERGWTEPEVHAHARQYPESWTGLAELTKGASRVNQGALRTVWRKARPKVRRANRGMLPSRCLSGQTIAPISVLTGPRARLLSHVRGNMRASEWTARRRAETVAVTEELLRRTSDLALECSERWLAGQAGVARAAVRHDPQWRARGRGPSSVDLLIDLGVLAVERPTGRGELSQWSLVDPGGPATEAELPMFEPFWAYRWDLREVALRLTAGERLTSRPDRRRAHEVTAMGWTPRGFGTVPMATLLAADRAWAEAAFDMVAVDGFRQLKRRQGPVLPEPTEPTPVRRPRRAHGAGHGADCSCASCEDY